MSQSLSIRLPAMLVGLFLMIGIALALLTRYSSERYHQEVTQRLNAPIAMYVAGEARLIHEGVVDTAALQALAHQAMIINPSIEVYLLDTDGRILGHDLGADTALKSRVDLGPIRRFLRGTAALPLRGDDPRKAGSRRIFTVAQIMDGDALEGYLYIVLGGEKYQQLAASADAGEALWLGTAAVVACLLFGLASALLIFARLTRRLKNLTARVHDYCTQTIGHGDERLATTHDEIVQLSRAFDAMQARIDEQISQIRETDRMRRELVAHVSHDLRTPVTTMQGYLETLALKHGDIGGERQQEYIGIVHRHARRLARLIDDLFALARLDAGMLEPVCDRFCLAELVSDVTREFALTAEHKSVTLTVERRTGDTAVHADIGMIERVFGNLLQNALDHTSAGGTITVRIDDDAGGIMITVADDGAGIAAKNLHRVFERGFRLPAAASSRPASTGLGLAIVKGMLALHGARPDVTSRPGQGAAFSFVLPRAAHGNVTSECQRPDEEPASGPQAATGSRTGRSGQIVCP